MKHKVALFVLLAMAVSTMSYAASSATDKLKRGAEGIFTSPLEICNNYRETRKEYGVPQSLASGVFVGMFDTGKRLINGTYDEVTFPVNYPSDYGLLWRDDYATALQEHRALNDAK